MPPHGNETLASGYRIDEARNSVVLERTLVAPPEKAFAFWTEPRHVSQWWDPSGDPLVECEIDLRVGGQLRFVGSRHEGPPFVGTYLEIDPPRWLVFEAMGAKGTVSIEPNVSGSKITVEIRAPDAATLKLLVGVGLASGTAQTLDNLCGYLPGQTPS